MRQRKAKDLEKRLQACSQYLIDCSARDVKGSYFDAPIDDDRELYLEIGCGKGNFIIKKALAEPDKNFIAIEGQETVILRALEKAAELGESFMPVNGGTDAASDGGSGVKPLSNLRFMLAFLHRMEEFFQEGQLSGIYLNFSDPWPKARHAKRRLTYRDRLRDYAWALKKGGFVEFKTDNDDLYGFSLEEITAAGYEIVEQTTDLHRSCCESRYTTTEYEEKFKNAGKNINYVKFIV